MIDKLRQEFIKYKIDALLISKKENVAYLSNFNGEGYLLITPKKKILIVDSRFKEQAAQEAQTFQIWQKSGSFSLSASLNQLARGLKLNRLGFEAQALTYDVYKRLKAALAPNRLVGTYNLVERLRAVKSAQEIKIIRKAAALAVKTYLFAQKIIRPGKKEKELARQLRYFMQKNGADDCAFEIIVASGKRSSLPHAPISDKTIQENESVLLDLGCRISGYNSDLTRVLFLGKIKDKIKRIYEVVLQAQAQAVKAVRPGLKISQLDRVARQYIAECGFATFFSHALGHGIGREVHEYPTISLQNQDVLKPGMVFTVEPAIYLPGVGGARIEDMVLVTEHGAEILTKAPKT